MVKDRDMALLQLVVDTINSWNSGHTARIHRTNVIVEKNDWQNSYTGYVQPASIVDGYVTFDPSFCKHARTDRVYFIDVANGLMAWGPREYIQQRVDTNSTVAVKFAAEKNSKFRIESIVRAANAPKTIRETKSDDKASLVTNQQPTDKVNNMKKVINSIWVTFEKEGVHKYPAALTDPKLATGGWDDVSFLGYPHRHMFKFKVTIEVFHDDRDIEFIQFKRWLERLYNDGTLQLDFRSCEMISDELAAKIAEKFPGRKIVIEVAEDGENGSYAAYVPE